MEKSRFRKLKERAAKTVSRVKEKTKAQGKKTRDRISGRSRTGTRSSAASASARYRASTAVDERAVVDFDEEGLPPVDFCVSGGR